jgi:polysaccharide export outer membrane protein
MLGLLLGCGGGSAQAPPPPPIDDTTLGPGDVFEVHVFQEDDLSGTYRVARDGTIAFPLVGQIEVAGHEPPEVSEMLARALREGEYLTDPQVSILVKETHSKHINVVGAVARPGMFTWTSGMTVVQAISQAGGFTAIASRNDIIISRRVDGRLRRFRVAVGDITEGTAEDLPLQSGDIVFVEERVF